MAEKTDAWMPLWIGDYLADTQHLSRDEHGGYMLLLIAYWRTASPLPDDDKRLCAIVKATPREWKTLRQTLAEFFSVVGGVWIHKRVERELAESRRRKESAEKKAKAAAQARWGQSPKDATSIPPSTPQAVPEQCPSPSPSPVSTKPATNVAVKKKRGTTLPDDFQPNDTGIAAAHGIDMVTELEAFRNYHTARASVMADWQAAWRTWAGNARKFAKPTAWGKPQTESFAAQDQRMKREAWELMTNEKWPDGESARATAGQVIDITELKRIA